MPNALSRLFRQGKSKEPGNVLGNALFIGNYSRITQQIPDGYQELEALLSSEEEPVSPTGASTGAPRQSSQKGTSLLGHNPSFKGFRHLLQHLGGGGGSTKDSHPNSPTPAEAEAQRQLNVFWKQLGFADVSFVPDDGSLTRERVLAKLTKLFKGATAPVVLVAYAGPSDERGNWRLPGQASAAGHSPGLSSAGGGGASAPAPGPASPALAPVVSFREVSMLWQRHRKHSQRLVLLLDCRAAGYWVAALRMLSKAEQLELSLGVQASDCSLPAVQARQLTYQPGIFTQLFLASNKWRREGHRRALQQPHASPSSQQHPQQQAAHASPTAGGGGGTPRGGAAGAGRFEPWLPGMIPSYYATWLNDHLADYGIALRFYNAPLAAAAHAVHGGLYGSPSASHGSVADPVARLAAVDVEADAAEVVAAAGRAGGGGARRASTLMMLAAESAKQMRRPSRLLDELTSTQNDLWGDGEADGGARSASTTAGVAAGSEGGAGPWAGPGGEGAASGAQRAATNARAISMPDAARRRYSSLADYYAAGGADAAPGMPVQRAGTVRTIPSQSAVEAAAAAAMQLSAPQTAFPPGMHFGVNSSSSTALVTRAPTMPQERLPTSPSAALHGAMRHADTGSGTFLSPAAPTTGTYASERLRPRGCGHLTDGPSGGAAPVFTVERDSDSASAQGSAVAVWRLAAAMDSGGLGGMGGTDCDEIDGSGPGGLGPLAVQHSARSDTCAVQWDRRSMRAEREALLMLDERGGMGMGMGGVAASFTGPAGGRRGGEGGGGGGGFDSRLFGALHEVATEQRLWARRAPLEGDESLDGLMEDADIERRASAASLPSFMLPRDGSHAGRGAAAGDSAASAHLLSAVASLGVPLPGFPPSIATGGGAGGGPAAGAGRPCPLTSGPAGVLSVLPGAVVMPGSGGPPAPAATPRVSIAAPPEALLQALLAGHGPHGSPAAQYGSARGVSRLHLSSRAGFSEELELAAAAVAAAMGGGGAGSSAEGELRELAQEQGASAGEGADAEHTPRERGIRGVEAEAGPQPRRTDSSDGGDGLLGYELQGLLPAARAAAAAMAATPSPQPCASPALSPQPSLLERRRLRASGAGGSNASGLLASRDSAASSSAAMLRSLLRQHVSIADSTDLDSASASPPVWARGRPGRWEVGGSESSSFLFGDDADRYEVLRALKERVEAAEAEAEEGGLEEGSECGEAEAQRWAVMRGADRPLPPAESLEGLAGAEEVEAEDVYDASQGEPAREEVSVDASVVSLVFA